MGEDRDHPLKARVVARIMDAIGRSIDAAMGVPPTTGGGLIGHGHRKVVPLEEGIARRTASGSRIEDEEGHPKVGAQEGLEEESAYGPMFLLGGGREGRLPWST